MFIHSLKHIIPLSYIYTHTWRYLLVSYRHVTWIWLLDMKIKIISNHLINLSNILLKLITCTMIIDTHTRLKFIYWNIIKMGNRYSAYVSPFLKHEFCFNDVCIIRFHILIPQSQGLSWHNRLNYFFLPLVISIYMCNMSIQEFSQILF